MLTVWRKAESAPRDGKPFLACVRDELGALYAVVCWNPGRGLFVEGELPFHVDYWMHLPKPPDGSAGNLARNIPRRRRRGGAWYRLRGTQ